MDGRGEADPAQAGEHFVAEDSPDQDALLRADRVAVVEGRGEMNGLSVARHGAHVVRRGFAERHGEDVPAAGAEDPEDLLVGTVGVRHVFQDVAGQHEVERGVAEGEVLQVLVPGAVYGCAGCVLSAEEFRGDVPWVGGKDLVQRAICFGAVDRAVGQWGEHAGWRQSEDPAQGDGHLALAVAGATAIAVA